MEDIIKKINELCEKRMNFLVNSNWVSDIYKWNETCLGWIKDELIEVERELLDNNLVYLEDELSDVLWNYISFLNSLKIEWKISSVEKVFERSYKKYLARINIDTWKSNWSWSEVKKKQKEELKIESENLYKSKNTK